MGKYPHLARKKREEEPQEKPIDTNYLNIYKHGISVDTTSNPDKPSPDSATNLRTTNLTNLIGPAEVPSVVPCIHRMSAGECAICSGYVRWLIEDEARILRAQRNPAAVRREFWEFGGLVVPNPTEGMKIEEMHNRVVHVLKEPYDLYIGRAHSGRGRGPSFKRSEWHNPFREGADGSREEVIEKYERYLLEERRDLMARLPELKGQVLACWCAPDPCHGDVLARLADEAPPVR